jgi:hypothetical protein
MKGALNWITDELERSITFDSVMKPDMKLYHHARVSIVKERLANLES